MFIVNILQPEQLLVFKIYSKVSKRKHLKCRIVTQAGERPYSCRKCGLCVEILTVILCLYVHSATDEEIYIDGHYTWPKPGFPQ